MLKSLLTSKGIRMISDAADVPHANGERDVEAGAIGVEGIEVTDGGSNDREPTTVSPEQPTSDETVAENDVPEQDKALDSKEIKGETNPSFQTEEEENSHDL